MTIDPSAFFSALLGTTIPGLLVSILLLWLNNRSSKSVESYKNELTRQLAEVQHTLTLENDKSKLWHERRVEALIEIYGAFATYLRFLREILYVPKSRGSMDTYFVVRETVEKNLLFLNDELGQFITDLNSELLHFWNWAARQKREPGITDDAVQQRLDKEIPLVLERLRVRINEFADPDYRSDLRAKS